MSEKLYNQAKKVFEEFNKYVEIYKKEINKIPVIWISSETGELFLYSEYERYSTRIKETVNSFGNSSKVTFFKDIKPGEMIYCFDCKYFNCYDDGDDRSDIWCGKEDHDIDDGKINLAPSCSDYEEIKE